MSPFGPCEGMYHTRSPLASVGLPLISRRAFPSPYDEQKQVPPSLGHSRGHRYGYGIRLWHTAHKNPQLRAGLKPAPTVPDVALTSRPRSQPTANKHRSRHTQKGTKRPRPPRLYHGRPTRAFADYPLNQTPTHPGWTGNQALRAQRIPRRAPGEGHGAPRIRQNSIK